MSKAGNISTNNPVHENALTYIVMMAVAVIIGTALRISLLLIYPFLVLFIAVFFRLKITSVMLLMIILVGFCFLFSFFGGFFLSYKLLSLFYMIPFIFLLFSQPTAREKKNGYQLAIFINCLAIIAFINDITGFVQVYNTPESDDSFLGIYSIYSISLSGLVLINTVLYFYYFVSFLHKRNFIHLLAGLFFLSSAVMGFYGAGLIISGIAVVLGLFRFKILSILKSVLIGLFSVAAIYFLIQYIKPDVIGYNIANLKKISSFDVANGPRKLTSFYNYGISYPKDPKDFFLGSGPGTFNSRSAFIIGSPSYFTTISFMKDDEQPYYFRNYAYTLWNETNTIQSMYLDGFRNQPFSSILAFLGEYGLIFTLAFFFFYYQYYKSVSHIYFRHKLNKQAEIYFRVFKFLIILLPLLLLIDNYFEYPEITILIILGIKFSHAGLLDIDRSSTVETN